MSTSGTIQQQAGAQIPQQQQQAPPVQPVGNGTGRLANAANLAAGIAPTRSLVIFSPARLADNATIRTQYLENPNIPDRSISWCCRQYVTSVFEAQFLRTEQASVHGEHAITTDSAGQTYLRTLYTWNYARVPDSKLRCPTALKGSTCYRKHRARLHIVTLRSS